jgi:FkbH-like protein
LNFKALKQNLKKDTSSFPAFKVALLGDTATQFLAIALRGTAVERGYRLDLFEAEYNQVERQIMDPDSELYEFKADYVIVFQSTHKLLAQYNQLPNEKLNGLADDRLAFVQYVCDTFSGRRERVIYCNYPEIETGIFGNFANKIESSFTWQTRKLNYELMRLASHNPNLFICDIAAVQNKLGRDTLFDSSLYTASDMILSIDSVPFIASRIMDIICAAAGRLSKCLILDLDNTLWGGVIGDDGLENIQLGHELGIGKAFTEFQQWIKRLKERGVIITICSKNNEETAQEPFVKHPDMVLTLDDISVFIANWNNKADNIRQIQSILNIGFDAMVFLDDNPAERAIVRQNIPGIIVPELPEDPADYLEYLYGLNLFETASYSLADTERTQQYQVEAQRVSLQQTFANEADFLKSLEMVSEISGFNPFVIPRVAQLSQRSNQFNLRTVRYTDSDVARLEADSHYKNFAFTLSDKFGENGLICVIILEKQDAETLFVDTWFMSCRVLKRGMENFTLNTIVDYARANGFMQIIGEYRATSKNKMVENHYPNLGFTPVENAASAGRCLYVLQTNTYKDKECFIKKTETKE